MDIQQKNSAKQTSVKISGECTIFHAAEAKIPLLQNIDKLDRKVVLDLSQITELDTAGVQLLLMFKKKIVNAGGKLKVSAISEPVRQVLTSFSLGEAFALEETSA